MFYRHCFYYCFFLLMFSITGVAQSYSFKHLSVEDGLSNNYVKDIIQDGQGCIWVATESGLSRFDGKHFTTYEENTSDIISNALNALLYDPSENKLWIGTKSGLSLFDCQTQEFNNYDSERSPKIENVAHLCYATDSSIWITSHNGGLFLYDRKKKEFYSYSTDSNIEETNYSHWTSFDDGKGKLYLGHARKGLSIIDLETHEVRNYLHDPNNPKSLPGHSVYSILIDHLQNIWIGTNQGLALFYPQTDEFLCFKHDPGDPYSLIADHIYNIKEMNDGSLWIACDIGGISILDLHNISFMNPENVRFFNISASSDNTGTSSNNIRSLLQDSFGNIWIGNYSSGVDFISHKQPAFHILPYIEKGDIPKNKPVWGICSDKEHQVWMGSENEIALFRNNTLIKAVSITEHINRPYAQVFTMKCNKQGLLWLGIYDDGLLTYNIQNNQFKRIELDIENMDIITFYEDNDGRMWIGAEYGLYSYFQGTLYKEEDIISQLRDWSTYGITRDRQGKLWVGSYGGGICIFDRENQLVETLSTEKGFCSNSISHLITDSKGGIWAATRNGIGYIKDTNHPDQFELYNYKQGLTETHVRALFEDESGNIWLSTNDGISFWNNKKQTFDNYDFRDGIPSGNFIEGSSCSTPDGTIYFGSLNGVCYFKPGDLSNVQQVAPVQIIDCRGFNKQIESRSDEYIIPLSNGRIRLPYDRNTFRISYTVPDYSQSRQVEYAYKMEGLENAWYNTQGENQITFRNLSPGEYTFYVKAKLRNQEWDETHRASVAILITPPLWLTWYAKLFYLLIFLWVVFFLLRLYKNRLDLKTSLELERKENLNKQELNNERLRFYTNVTHELRTPLTLILGPLEDLINDRGLPSPYNQKISTIHRSALRLLNLINQILEFRKTETQNRRLTVSKEDLSRLVREIGLRYKELNQNDKIDFRIIIETKEVVLFYDVDMVTSILNNLLSNAIKYTTEGEIKLIMRSVAEENNIYTEIEVRDTGYGIDEKAIPYIFDRYYQAKGKHQASGSGIGLALVKSLVELHEGILSVESHLGEGTTFRFRLLTENTYPNALHAENKIESEVTQDLATQTKQEEKEGESCPIILVIEDNDDIRDYIATSLSPHYIVHVATNGKEGLQLAQKEIPNMIVSDIMMPEMDGLEFCRLIKEDIRTCHIPVILLTAKDSIHDKEEGYESGADSYLTKPFSAKLLLSRIHNLLESRRRLANIVSAHSNGIKPSLTDHPEEGMRINPLDEKFLNKITQLIEENLDWDKLDIAFLKDKMNMSHSTFYRKVKALTGISANEFIRKVRLKNSLRLLLSGTYNISETAYMIGFNDVSYFRQCFKEEYGISPSEYVKKMKE
ncbi:signal transduction histidine kinase/ligand-binding sensor domain-containing protein/DNA-binding response OmpR family regulator [Parabacteroides sp. PFB2-12]|uniref:hybrid sensor histidine kinase/response regulator transcription factor n=1 Tax=unclassified Parabacteroides TaxID=2649774 RepID=UPI002473C1D8|nr:MULTISPECIES: hybrid sensor histidine kinase/response regulator transcription factor [unclassified Parabacteroides]MDH6342768.1 signal transduction histidine kinase/ligand-binding sensor domain-containing protein/DNA-binding response OmpR family regulator [Parabacteroides sp. PM6-13]MDH6391464.1 signal transduction histidine kinase/ligand-binding sensor domain-containing protein/DNA-binding response OmpR family regulator [Parabacteroides sp. PFB2-12]